MSEVLKKFYKKALKVNGNNVSVIVDQESFLSDVIRKQLGLTGTKVGCKAGQCGICSAIIDGKVVRTCNLKMKRVRDGASITTIEGIGTPDSLHPIQLAWIKFGGAQCGFCTPGFIVSAKALLDNNVNPTREEVRDWFQKHRNLCRCTGYKPLVDAVMAAAAVMRGDMKLEELNYEFKDGESILGSYAPRPSAVAKVTGTFDYGADDGLKMPEGSLQLALVQAKVSHAKILSVDTSEAEKMPGVECVLTYKDVKGTNRILGCDAMPGNKCDGLDRPILCEDKVFQYGDAIAIICADTKEHANAAIDKVKVELEELPAYMSAYEAMADDAIEIHPGTPNVFCEMPIVKGKDTKPIMESAAYVAEASYYTTRQPHLILEPDVGYAYFDEEGRLTIHSKSICLYLYKDFIAQGLGVKKEDLRMIQNNMGATFGYKMAITGESLLGVACIATGKPVYLEFDMFQQITYTGKRAPCNTDIKMAADEEGNILAMEEVHVFDHGSYSPLGDDVLFKANKFIGFGYDIENIRGLGKVVFTNHAYCTAFRSYGSPQVEFASESLIDELAEKVGMDPLEFRYKNVYRPGDTMPTGQSPEVYSLSDQIDWLRPKYQAALKKAKAMSTDEIKYGVGISLAGYNAGCDFADFAEAWIELLPEGKVAVYNCWQDHGQGSDMGTLTIVHETLKPLNISVNDIVLVMNDTAKCPDGGVSAASRGQIMIGTAIKDACEKLIAGMKKADGTFRTFDEMTAEKIALKYAGNFATAQYCTPWDPKTSQCNPSIAYMYGMFMTELQVNIKTGKTTVNKMTFTADCGKIINKLSVDGQMYGGMVQGVGLALSEDFDDLSKHVDLIRCGIPYIKDAPDEMEVFYFETPRDLTAYGSSGVGELPLSSPHASIVNGIYNACGVRIRELPALPAKVLAGLKK